MAEQPKMPLHEHMQEQGDAPLHIINFLEWLESQPYFICEARETNDGWDDELRPIRDRGRKLMLRYFDVGETEWIAEKDALLAWIQKENSHEPSADG